MEIKKFLQERLLSGLLWPVSGVFAYLMVRLIDELWLPITNTMLMSIEKVALLHLIELALVSSLFLLACLLYLLWELKRFKLAFGVLWDRRKNPRCPACKSGLTWRGFNDYQAFVLECIKCKSNIPLMDNMGRNLNLPAAQKLL